MIPLNDRVLIRRIEEPEQRIGSIIVPDIAKSRAIKGEIVAVGRGKWHPGEWWCVKVGTHSMTVDNWAGGPGVEANIGLYEWQWIDGWLEVPPVYPGQQVYFNSKWSDVGEDYQHPGVGWDESLHMVQIADIFAIAN